MPTQSTEQRVGALKAGDASLPLTKMEIAGAITGLLHRTKVSQTFLNDHEVPLEAIYTHPLPPKAAVHGFRLVVGNRVVEGQVQERRAARQAYAQAISQGRRAALMEEDRSDIFTTTVGNIAPGEQVTITFELSGPLEFLESTASLRFPLVVPEVYISGNPLGGGDVGDGTSADTDSVPDASRLTPPRLAEGAPNPVNLKLAFHIDPAGLELEKVDSLCHFAKTRPKDDGCFEISLLPGVERLDRDFVVRLKLKEGTLQTTLVNDPETGTFALTVVPPLGQGEKLAARDLVIVLDRSGSMQGWSMTAARRAAARMVESLTPMDRFALIAFDDQLELLDPHLVPADLRQKERAAKFLSKIDSRGGTEARPAIDKALQMLKLETSSDKTVLFITDGDVGNDSELVVRGARGVRVSTVGIGHNSRAGVLESMARTSGGLCSLIPEESTLEESLRHLHQRLGRPHWMGVSVNGVNANQQAPRYWDVWEGVPVTFFGRCAAIEHEVTVEGWLASTGLYRQKVPVCRRDDLVIHRSWARARLLDLDDQWTIGKAQPHELVALSVDAQVLCRFTAFTAIDVTEVVANSAKSKTVIQPVERTLRASRATASQVHNTDALEQLTKDRPVRVAEMLKSIWLSDEGTPTTPRRSGGGGMAPPPPAPAAGMFDAQRDSGLFDEAPNDVFGAPHGGALGSSFHDEADGSFDDLWVEERHDSFDDLELPEYLPPQPESAGSSFLSEVWSTLTTPFRSKPGPAKKASSPGDANNESLGRQEAKPPALAQAKTEPSPLKRPKEPDTKVWRTLLELLSRFLNAVAQERGAVLEQMIETLGDHCRKTPTGSPDANTGKEVMSLLIDLQLAVNDGIEVQAQVEHLRSVLEALD